MEAVLINLQGNDSCMAKGKSHLYRLTEHALKPNDFNTMRARRHVKTIHWWQRATLEKKHASTLTNVRLKPICRATSSHLSM